MSEHLSIVFYNTENLFDTQDDRRNRGDDEFIPGGFQEWTPERLAKKIRHTAEALCLMKQVPPALFGLCEIENRHVLDLLITDPLFSKTPYEIIHRESEDSRGMDCAL